MSAQKHHDYHLVDPSPWPLVAALAMLMLPTGTVFAIHGKHAGIPFAIAGLSLVLFVMFVWWRDVVREGAKRPSDHTSIVQHGLRLGMALFIASEVMFFFGFFWSFFHSSLTPRPILEGLWPIAEGIWPPKGVKTFDAFDLPFMNTLILLLSGTTVTWAHFALLHKNQKELIQALTITVLLGMTFTLLQATEYHHAPFAFKDGIYSSNFFMATGFHGLHVIIGTIFLTICLLRARRGQLSPDHHLGFEFAAWYWHFVDVVWLFLFIFVYWWGGA
ncbi:MAG: cytochrome c oxidase subunit 3 [Proteobacteria bacterium]|nr:cytochrome c oxidase subunit 3 [Pseudomonadota bacterium]